MKFVVRLHAEITIKSRSVRKRHGKVLTNNLRKVLAQPQADTLVKWLWDRIEVTAEPATDADDELVRRHITESLQNTPGISWFAEVEERSLSDFETLAQWVGDRWLQSIEQRSFVVRVKRKGHHDFNSQQLERYIGGYLLEHSNNSSVKLKHADVEIKLQIIEKNIQLVGRRQEGLGGFPIPTQETVVSLMSGGFDSSVASYEFIRRGARTHFCFFNLGGDAHEVAVRQISHYLWQRFSASHPIKFVSVDFAPVVEDILKHCDNGLMGVVLKRQMLRAAERVARYLKAQALVTGEATGQVSSQTLSNLNVIDSATDALVLRPLITRDKQEIVDIAKKIGTEPLAKSIPEYCGVISNKPTVRAIPEEVEARESKLDMELLKQVVNDAQVLTMTEIGAAAEQQAKLEPEVATADLKRVIVDIRNNDEIEEKPLQTDLDVLEIPFFKLQSEFVNLDADKHYLLYCAQGVMSKMQALLLQEAGYHNVSVYSDQ
ncbi:MAG: tRNA uracil 4-sulfurtransferase ThiI [Pseudomonadota bacterium]